MTSSTLDLMQGHPVFDAQPTPVVVLDREFVIRAANRAYVATAARDARDLLGQNIFEAFPDNPEDPETDGTAMLQASLQRVVRTGRPHNMLIQRYDVPDPKTGTWQRRFWTPFNAPIRNDGEVVGVMHRVQDVTPLHRRLERVLGRYGAILRSDRLSERQAAEFVEAAHSYVDSASEYHDLLDEVRHLRRALSSRATIDQAKGIVMAERRCTPDEAFEVLSRLSQETNVKLADVAAALVYQAQGPGSSA